MEVGRHGDPGVRAQYPVEEEAIGDKGHVIIQHPRHLDGLVLAQTSRRTSVTLFPVKVGLITFQTFCKLVLIDGVP